MISPVMLIDKKCRGFTLIELLIVIALVLILVGISIPLYGNLQQLAQINDVSSNIIQTIRTAQNRAVSGMNNYSHGVYFDIDPSGPDSMVLYQGNSYATRVTSLDRVISISETVELSETISGGSEINFTKGTGAVSESGSVSIDHTSGVHGKVVNINESGYATEQ